jgi:hypothetical protein
MAVRPSLASRRIISTASRTNFSRRPDPPVERRRTARSGPITEQPHSAPSNDDARLAGKDDAAFGGKDDAGLARNDEFAEFRALRGP